MRIFYFIIILTILFILSPELIYVSAGRETEFYTHFIYLFFHANIFHLISNCMALCVLKPNKDILLAYLIAVAVSFGSNTPIIGLSGFLFALLGIQYGITVSTLFVGKPGNMIKPLVLPLIPLLLSSVFGKMATFVHFAAWTLGFTIGYIKLTLFFWKNDCKGYNSGK